MYTFYTTPPLKWEHPFNLDTWLYLMVSEIERLHCRYKLTLSLMYTPITLGVALATGVIPCSVGNAGATALVEDGCRVDGRDVKLMPAETVLTSTDGI